MADSPAARFALNDLLRSSAVQKIDFSIGPYAINGPGYLRVAAAVVGRSMGVDVDPKRLAADEGGLRGANERTGFSYRIFGVEYSAAHERRSRMHACADRQPEIPLGRNVCQQRGCRVCSGSSVCSLFGERSCTRNAFGRLP